MDVCLAYGVLRPVDCERGCSVIGPTRVSCFLHEHGPKSSCWSSKVAGQCHTDSLLGGKSSGVRDKQGSCSGLELLLGSLRGEVLDPVLLLPSGYGSNLVFSDRRWWFPGVGKVVTKTCVVVAFSLRGGLFAVTVIEAVFGVRVGGSGF